MNDDELLAHLKAADPARTSPAPQPAIPRLVEATMATTTDTTPQATTITARHSHPRLVLATAAAAAILGVGITWGVTAQDSGTSPADPPLALTLANRGPGEELCAAPTVDSLRRYPLAFEGTVTIKKGDLVDLRVDHWFRGGNATTVRLSNDETQTDAWRLDVGKTYLVTADNAVVPVCGGTTSATDEARRLFHEAFDK